jgi:hypothetical protein
MRGTFGEISKASIEWTKTVLFRPFVFKKWIMLFIIAMIAMQLRGGCNANFNSSGSGNTETTKQTESQKNANTTADKEAVEQKGIGNPIDAVKSGYNSIINKWGKPMVIGFAVGIILLLALLVLSIIWLYSHFTFIFIGAVKNNEASIKKPFSENYDLGLSFFKFNLVYTFVGLFVLGSIAFWLYRSLSGIGVFSGIEGLEPVLIFKTVILPVILGVILILLSAIFSFIVNHYLIIIMYKKRYNFLKALPIAFKLVADNKGAFIKYIFYRIFLMIVISIISLGILILQVLGILIVAGPVIAVVVYLFGLIAGIVKMIVGIVLLLTGVPLAIAALMMFAIVYLPFTVFFKTFNLKFIARLDDEYDLFRLKEKVEVSLL